VGPNPKFLEQAEPKAAMPAGSRGSNGFRGRQSFDLAGVLKRVSVIVRRLAQMFDNLVGRNEVIFVRLFELNRSDYDESCPG
jgi:hypothetical protein